VKELAKALKTQNATLGNQQLVRANFCRYPFFHSFSALGGDLGKGWQILANRAEAARKGLRVLPDRIRPYARRAFLVFLPLLLWQ
jgi:hypothetical protein